MMFLTKRIGVGLILMLLCVLLSACEPSSEEQAETAAAATSTPSNSPTPASTVTSTPTPAPTPVPMGPFQPVLPEKELPLELTSILRISADGTLWLQTEQEILILRENTWEIALAEIPGELVGVDEAGRVWVINSDGSSISSWNGKVWSTYAEDSGWMPFDDYFSIVGPPITDQLGQVWIVSSRDLRVFADQRWKIFTPKDLGLFHPLEAEEEALPDLHLSFLERTRELWLGTCNWTGAGPIGGQGVLRYNSRSWGTINTAITSGCTEAIVEDGKGGIWIGLDGDIWRYDTTTESLEKFDPPLSPGGGSSFFNAVGAITLDSEYNPWADFLLCGGGGCGGGKILYRFTQGEWIKIIEEDLWFYDLIFDQSGMPWLLTPSGIFKIEENKPVLFLELPIIPDSAVQNNHGQVWFLVKWDEKIQLWTTLPELSN